MYSRYYDPEIFVQTLDGIDRTSHIVATYFMDDELPGEDFVDHFALIQSMALEGSTGTWEKVEEDTEDVRRKLSGRMVGYFEIPTGSASRRAAVVQLAFPIEAWGDNVAMMVLSVAGNCFAFSDKLRLLDLLIPDKLLANFKGPKFGVPGIRKLTNVPDPEYITYGPFCPMHPSTSRCSRLMTSRSMGLTITWATCCWLMGSPKRAMFLYTVTCTG